MFKIGFNGSAEEHRKAPGEAHSICPAVTPRKSVVRVHFPARNMNLSYYNDAFDLKCGDIVFVEGKLEGLRGRVVDVAYNFKIKLSDYKRVISVADTNVQGEFFFAGSHFVTFDRSTLPYEKVITWFKAPAKEDEMFVSGNDETARHIAVQYAQKKWGKALHVEGNKIMRLERELEKTQIRKQQPDMWR